jgi:hypothetical protein
MAMWTSATKKRKGDDAQSKANRFHLAAGSRRRKPRLKNGQPISAKSLPLNPQLRTCPNDPVRCTLSAKT